MKEDILYLDHAATTKPADEVIAAVNEVMAQVWGNPSSVHALGYEASRLLETARARVLSALGVRFPKPGQLVFTASGTEADNLALLGIAKAKNHPDGAQIIITDSEHPAIASTASYLEQCGFDVVRLSTKNGVLDMDALARTLSPRTILVSIMAANNETGAVYDLKSAFSLVHQRCPRALTHTDAVQAFGKIPLFPEKIGADMVSLSAHKIHGIKGAGALYLSQEVLKRRALAVQTHGGGQEGGLRSGTEAMPAIVGFGVAAEMAAKRIFNDTSASLRAHLLSVLDARVRVNQPAGNYLPSTVSITLPSVKSEVMLRFLSERGIYVSAGSACSSHKKTASPTLLAFGLTAREADCTIRVSFSEEQTMAELSRFASALREGLDSLAKIREMR